MKKQAPPHLQKSKNSRLLIIIAVFLVCIPFMFLAVQVYRFGSNTPYMDQWELTADFRKVDNGSYGLNDLWRQHNEHRLLFPRIVMLILAYSTSWNTRVETLVNLVFAALMFTAIYLLIKENKVLHSNRYIFFLILLLSSILIFSFTQAENWLWGWQMQWYMACTGVLATVYFLNREKLYSRNLLLAIISAFFASYSLGSGIIVWPIGLAILVVNDHKIRYWLVAFLITAASYYVGFKRSGLETSIADMLTSPHRLLVYIFAYVGRPLSENKYYACIFGLIGVLVFLYCTYINMNNITGTLKRRLKPLLLPLSLATFVLASAFITAVSRYSLGTGQALASRYTTVSSLFWIGLAMMITITIYSGFKIKRNLQALVASNVLLILLGVSFAATNRSALFFGQHAGLIRDVRYCVNQLSLTDEDDCLLKTYPSKTKARADIEYLRKKNWAGF